MVDIGAGRTTPQPSLFTVNHIAPFTQSWAVLLGREDYVSTLVHQFGSHQKAVKKLCDLVTLPSKTRLAKITNTIGKALEHGLLLSNSLNQTYMKDGVKQSLISIESFLLWSLVDQLMNTQTAILVYHSKDTMDATKDLLELILASEGSPGLDELMSKKHTLYLSILQAGMESEDKVACPLDQSLVEDDARFQDLEGDSGLESGTSDDESTSGSVNSNTNYDSIDYFNPCDISDWDIESALHSLHNKLEVPSHVNSDAGEPHLLPTLNKVLDKYLDLITTSKQVGFITPFQCIVNISLVLYKDSAHKPTFHTSFQEGNITLTNYVDTPIILPLTKICTVVHWAMTDFISKVEVALPPGATIKGLPLHHLSDDFSSTPLHNQPANSKILQPILINYWNQVLAGQPCHKPLYSDTGLNWIEADKWLADYDTCFPQAACAITLSSGGIDSTTFWYHHYAGPDRTVFLLKNGTIAFVNPIHSN
ncbi:hypothetical protein H4582DRAFT_2063715 [Lactarius indigo]|nr:hypothetical protein H4582DRAFT_2063715 [Lactarius indigo]